MKLLAQSTRTGGFDSVPLVPSAAHASRSTLANTVRAVVLRRAEK